MAVSLADSAKLSNDQVHRGVIAAMTTNQPLLDRLRFEHVEGNSFAFSQEGTAPSIAFRAVNAGYVESAGTYTQTKVALARLGGDAAVDRFIAQTRGNLNDQRAAQTVMAAKALAKTFQDAFINGTEVGGSFDGLNEILDGTSQEVVAATNGLPVLGSDDDDRHAFLDKLSEVVSLVPGANLILANDAILSKYRAAARRMSVYDETKDEFGKVVNTFNGIPFVSVGTKANGSQIITQDETQGTSSVASSIYVVNLADENGVIGLTNGGVQVYDIGESDAKPQYITRIEFYCAIAALAPNSAAVLRGVLNS